jgi:hypothetical protein
MSIFVPPDELMGAEGALRSIFLSTSPPVGGMFWAKAPVIVMPNRPIATACRIGVDRFAIARDGFLFIALVTL